MSRKKAQPFKIRNVLPYAYHEAGHAVVGHVIGRLIERWCRESLTDSEQCSRVKEDCLAQARSILARSVDAVDALAVELVLYEQVAGGEANRLIREALGENGDDWRLIAWGIEDKRS